MEIVRMGEAHVGQIAALEREYFSLPWSEVAVEGDWVLGYVGSQTVLGESDMLNLAVRLDCRRRGIGRALVEALCAALQAENAVCLTLEVRASNEAAKALYAALGFIPVGRRPRYYTRPTEDAELFRKELIP